MKSFFNRIINYSACNENSDAEYYLLELEVKSKVCCVLGGGERFLNLLTYDECPEYFDLIDANKSQFYLLDLKLAAYENLNYSSFIKFIGLTNYNDRIKVYKSELRDSLAPEVRKFWDNKTKHIKKGIIYQGKFEKFLKLVSVLIRIFLGNRVEKLLETSNIAEQKEYFNKNIYGWRWNLLSFFLFRKVWFKILTGDPAFFKHESIPNYKIYLSEVFKKSMTEENLQHNFLFPLMFLGRYHHESNNLPRCYRKENFNLIKNRLKSIIYNTHHTYVNDFLEGNKGLKYTAFSLSDVVSYLDYDSTLKLFDLIEKRSDIHAKAVIRQLFTRYSTNGLMLKKGIVKSLMKEDFTRYDNSLIWSYLLYEK